MLKLMKYEFRKSRNVLLIMLAALAVLEGAFLIGDAMKDNRIIGVSVGLLIPLGFAVYIYMLVAGITSYSKELNDKTGYMAFMVPVSPAGIVTSKLLYTILSALVVTALFGVAAYIDILKLLKLANVNTQDMEALYRLFTIQTGSSLTQVLMNILATAASVIIEFLTVMCTAYLAITLSATLLRNTKGFWRILASVLLFFLLQFIANRASSLILGETRVESAEQVVALIGRSVLLDGVFCVLYGAASAILLDRKVDL